MFFEVADFIEHCGDTVRRTAEPEKAMATEKPEILMFCLYIGRPILEEQYFSK
jgi:hypothetical protein